ncbi:MAG: flagella basal body P-ring formation protein FlgA [Alteraurantiacibacter sp.]|nr:flagella basal body P-ring formation protein FlgA [Alteraurantiacibacter sp.]
MNCRSLLVPFALAVATAGAPLPAIAQGMAFADPAAIDAQVAAFTGAPVGAPSGARQPVDRRLRMAACPQPLTLAWHGRRADMVRVECPAIPGWQVFVPINTAPGSSQSGNTPASRAANLVERGQVVTIAVEGRGFTVTQQGEALEAGALGEWIRVRPEGSRQNSPRAASAQEPVRARIAAPDRVVIPLG